MLRCGVVGMVWTIRYGYGHAGAVHLPFSVNFVFSAFPGLSFSLPLLSQLCYKALVLSASMAWPATTLVLVRFCLCSRGLLAVTAPVFSLRSLLVVSADVLFQPSVVLAVAFKIKMCSL
jgi:hypothetical protein